MSLMVLDYIKLKEIKPVLAGYLGNSKMLLLKSPVPDEKTIHDIRVLMKKSRSTIKLLISQLEDETFKREYNSYREIGRILCSWRESSVFRKTVRVEILLSPVRRIPIFFYDFLIIRNYRIF